MRPEPFLCQQVLGVGFAGAAGAVLVGTAGFGAGVSDPGVPVPIGWKERNRGERMLAVRGRLGFDLRTAGVARKEGFRLVGR